MVSMTLLVERGRGKDRVNGVAVLCRAVKCPAKCTKFKAIG